MSRGQVVILAAFLLLTGGLAALVGPALVGGRPARTRTTVALPAPPAPSEPPAPPPGPPSPKEPVAAAGEGRAAAVAPVTVILLEADGSPAVGAPVAWQATDGRPRTARTDARGVATIDDRAPGVVYVKAGGVERAGPILRPRAGVDREVSATLDPPWTVTGRVVDADGAPVPGARVRGVWPEGSEERGPWNAVTGPDGGFRWRGRGSDRLALLVEHEGHATARVEPARPDPRRPAVTSVDVRLAAASPPVRVALDLSGLPGGSRVRLRAEPSVLALLREAYGPLVVAWDAAEDVVSGGDVWTTEDAVPAVPVRITVRGGVVPEDHVLLPGDARRARLPLAPRPLARDAAPAATPAPAGTAALRGTVEDPDGRALPGVTVVGGGRRVVTDERGRFALEGLVPGERIDLLYAWLDGADAGDVEAGAYAPWAMARLAPVPEPVVLRLPRSAGVTFLAADGLDRTPLSWVRVAVVDGDGDRLFDDVVATRDGRATITGIAPGLPGTMFVFAPGLRREVPLALRAGRTVDLGEVPLVRGGRVEGVVRSRDGGPVAGAVVAATDDGRGERDARGIAREADLALRRTSTDEEGRFTLEGLDATRPTALAVWADGWAPTARRVLWPEDGRARLTITLARGVTARIRLSERRGGPVSGALLDFTDGRTGARVLDLWHRAAWGSAVGSTEDVRRATRAFLVEDPRDPGLYLVGPLEPGPYDVAIEHPLYKPMRSRYSVVDPSPEGADNPLRLPLEGMEWKVDLEPVRDPGR